MRNSKLNSAQTRRLQAIVLGRPFESSTEFILKLAMLLALGCTIVGSAASLASPVQPESQTRQPMHTKPNQTVQLLGNSVVSADPNASQTYTLRLKIKNKRAETVSVVANADDELVVGYQAQSIKVGKNGVVELPITVQTSVAGRFYIMLDVQEHSATGMNSANSVGVAVQVGPRKVSMKARSTQAGSAHPVRVFHAEEEIISSSE